MRKTLLVTGCAGFIGSNFCRLYDSEYRIIGIDALVRGSHIKNISEKIIFFKLDITSHYDLINLFQKFPEIEGIINFAAETHVDHSLSNDSLFWTTNVLGVRHMAQIALKKGIRFLQCSTDEVYGPHRGGPSFEETSALNPRNPYAASKAAADLLLLSYYESYRLDYIITRGTNTIGPQQSLEKVLPKAIVHFLKNKPFPLYKTPAKRMWLGVTDHCTAIMSAFQKGQSGEIYNISPDQECEMETALLIDRVRCLMGRGEIQEVTDRAAYDLRYFISPKKSRTQLNWAPKQTLLQLIHDTVLWYQNNIEWIETHSMKPSL